MSAEDMLSNIKQNSKEKGDAAYRKENRCDAGGLIETRTHLRSRETRLVERTNSAEHKQTCKDKIAESRKNTPYIH